MSGQKVGYIRVSSLSQNLDRQLDGMALDKVFKDKASGKSLDRPQLKELIEYVREGDTVVVHSLDRLGRNAVELDQLIKGFTSKGIKVQFIKEGYLLTGDDSPMNKLLISMMGAWAEFERNTIRERQLEGIATAKRKGLYKGGKRKLTEEQAKELKERVESGESKTQVAKDFGLTRQGLYNYLKR